MVSWYPSRHVAFLCLLAWLVQIVLSQTESPSCTFTILPIFPSEGETLTILPTNTAGFEQVFEVSVVSGYTCPGNMTVTAGVDIDGITETLAPLTFPLSTNAGSISAVYYGLTITPQILTMAAFVTNQVASTSVDFVYTTTIETTSSLPACSLAFSPISPTAGETLTVAPSSGASPLEQVVELSAISGYTCLGNVTMGAEVYVDGTASLLNRITAGLGTGSATASGTYYGLASSTLISQTMIFTVFVADALQDVFFASTYFAIVDGTSTSSSVSSMPSSSGGSITSLSSYTSSLTSALSRTISSGTAVMNGTMPATPKGPIIGGVVGGVLVIGLVTGVLFLVYRLGQKNPRHHIPERDSANLGHWNRGQHGLNQAETTEKTSNGLRYPDEERLGEPRETSEIIPKELG